MVRLFFKELLNRYLLILIVLTTFGFIGIKNKAIDFTISDFFWDFKTGWFFQDKDFWFYFLYKYAKKVFITFLITTGFLALFSSVKHIEVKKIIIRNFKFQMVFCICLAVSYIIIISKIRSNSNTPCPRYSKRYRGHLPTKRPFDPIRCDGCKCFPGAHSTVGFSIIFFSLLTNKRRKKFIIITTGLILGYICGFYQILRGEHYFFDNYFSMIIALWMLFIIIYLQKILREKPRNL